MSAARSTKRPSKKQKEAAQQIEDAKRNAGYAAADRYVTSGMTVGMGTGSTAVWAIRRIAERLAAGEIGDVIGVATGTQSEIECQSLGIPVRSLNDPQVDGRIDVTIDGADEIDAKLRLIKGGGGALLIEKIIAYSSARYVVVADEAKRVENLGQLFPVPVEVLALARVPVLRSLEELGGEPQVRLAERKMGPVITDNGNILIDVRFPEPVDPVEMERQLSEIPGVLGNGFFTRVQATVLIGQESGDVISLQS